MTIERIDKSRIMGLSGDDLDRFVEDDFRIRNGLCPNGHGLMATEDGLQHCSVCKFTTNVLCELDPQ